MVVSELDTSSFRVEQFVEVMSPSAQLYQQNLQALSLSSVAVLIQNQLVSLPNHGAVTQLVRTLALQNTQLGEMEEYVADIRRQAFDLVENSKQEHSLFFLQYQEHLKNQLQAYVSGSQREFDQMKIKLMDAERRAVGSAENELHLTTAYEQQHQKMLTDHLEVSAELMQARSDNQLHRAQLQCVVTEALAEQSQLQSEVYRARKQASLSEDKLCYNVQVAEHRMSVDKDYTRVLNAEFRSERSEYEAMHSEFRAERRSKQEGASQIALLQNKISRLEQTIQERDSKIVSLKESLDQARLELKEQSRNDCPI